MCNLSCRLEADVLCVSDVLGEADVLCVSNEWVRGRCAVC
jgi:hypothetical protein